ncbi:hypothetical protein BGZ83_003790 [Gryganskiella cystojenkinii]|nr:hypothetical protein BGZ83_003790 [Gryganskiella cystojenkinii]
MAPIQRVAQISSHLRAASSRVSSTILSRNLTSSSSNASSSTLSTPHKITNRDRAYYPYAIDIQSRWADNDQYGHLNNAHYYALFDTVINTFLIQETGLNPLEQTQESSIGVVAESGCQYFSSLSFPDMIEARLAVIKLGRSSVVYQVGIFKKLGKDSPTGSVRPGTGSGSSVGVFSKAASSVATGEVLDASQFEKSQVQGDAAATGHFCHVFVNNASRRPVPIPQRIRAGLEQLQVNP